MHIYCLWIAFWLLGIKCFMRVCNSNHTRYVKNKHLYIDHKMQLNVASYNCFFMGQTAHMHQLVNPQEITLRILQLLQHYFQNSYWTELNSNPSLTSLASQPKGNWSWIHQVNWLLKFNYSSFRSILFSKL